MDYKKLAEAPVFRGLSERFLENFIGRTPNALREFGIGDFIALQGTACFCYRQPFPGKYYHFNKL